MKTQFKIQQVKTQSKIVNNMSELPKYMIVNIKDKNLKILPLKIQHQIYFKIVFFLIL